MLNAGDTCGGQRQVWPWRRDLHLIPCQQDWRLRGCNRLAAKATRRECSSRSIDPRKPCPRALPASQRALLRAVADVGRRRDLYRPRVDEIRRYPYSRLRHASDDREGERSHLALDGLCGRRSRSLRVELSSVVIAVAISAAFAAAAANTAAAAHTAAAANATAAAHAAAANAAAAAIAV